MLRSTVDFNNHSIYCHDNVIDFNYLKLRALIATGSVFFIRSQGYYENSFFQLGPLRNEIVMMMIMMMKMIMMMMMIDDDDDDVDDDDD